MPRGPAAKRKKDVSTTFHRSKVYVNSFLQSIASQEENLARKEEEEKLLRVKEEEERKEYFEKDFNL